MAKASPGRSKKNSGNGSDTTSKASTASAKPSASALTVKVEEVRRRAYEIYEQEGRLDGRDQEHWFRAEAEVHGTRKTA